MTKRKPRPGARLGQIGDAVVAGLAVVSLAPVMVLPTRTGGALLARVGAVVLPLLPAARRITDNVALVRPAMGPRETARLVRGVGAAFARTLAEYVRLPTLAARPECRETEGIEHLRAAVAAGRGVVVASAHFGNWEMIRCAARDAGVEVAIIYRAFNNRPFDWVARTRIRAAGEPVLHKGREGMRGMLGLLRRGGVILVLMDQHGTGGSPLPFMGRPAATINTIPALCRRSGAALVPARALRLPDGERFHVRFEPPIAVDEPDAMALAVNRRIEAWVDEAPEQWFWLHRRWRKGVGEAPASD